MMKKGKKRLWIILLAISLFAIAGVSFLNQPRFGKLPSGKRLERIQKSPNYKNGEFQNELPTIRIVGNKNFFTSMYEFFFKTYPNTTPDPQAIKVVKTDLKKLDPDQNLLVWFGHSSYLLQVNGKRILVDPVFYKASPVSLVNKAFPGLDVYKPSDFPQIDYLIISHDHWDHLDYQTVTELKDKVGKVICGLGVGEDFEYWGYDKNKIIELNWGENAEIGNGFKIFCLPARHFSGRGLRPNKTVWASYLIQTPTDKIYIGGDSGYDPHFKKVGEQFPGISLAVLENGQYNKNWPQIHTMPEFLEMEARELGAKEILTVHHSKYKLSTHPWDEPLKNEQKLRRDSLNVLAPTIGKPILWKTAN
ncbi:MAG: MBL fold metallo-hydrolase [Fibrobacteraceae bacterium]|nr:MBL fold metallo-hydrolase [Fibrobacteraceae bacterium]